MALPLSCQLYDKLEKTSNWIRQKKKIIKCQPCGPDTLKGSLHGLEHKDMVPLVPRVILNHFKMEGHKLFRARNLQT